MSTRHAVRQMEAKLCARGHNPSDLDISLRLMVAYSIDVELEDVKAMRLTTPLPPNDPGGFLLDDEFTSAPNKDIYRETCYICLDPEFAQMGLPLCYPCNKCGGHVAADDTCCDDCGEDQQPHNQDKEDQEPGSCTQV